MTSSARAEAKPFRARFDRPGLIVSAPRSGSTLLFETLAQSPDVVTIGDESHRIIEGVPELSMPARDWASNRLEAQDATPDVAERLSQAFYGLLHDRDGRRADSNVRMLEKTPKNALRVPFFDAIWPDTQFVFLYRDARQTLASMMEAWLSGYFRTYPRLPGWTGLPWSLLLVPNWQELIGRPLPEIVAWQWATTMNWLVSDLERLPAKRVRALAYEQLVRAPNATIESLAAGLDIGWDRPLDDLPLSRTTVSKPEANKWKAVENDIAAVWPIVAEVDARARAFVDSRRV